jgi:hypothetical protein
MAKVFLQKHAPKKPKASVPVESLLDMFDDHELKSSLQLKSSDNGTEVNCFIAGPAYPPSLKTLAAGMMAGFAGKVFKFRMTRTATLVTSGAGSMALATFVYPSQFDQYASLVNLFQEARIIGCRISYSLVPNMAGGTLIGGAFTTCWNPSANTTAGFTPLISTVTRFPNCKMFSTSNTNWPIRLKCQIPTNYPWSFITATDGATDPVGGHRGAFGHVFMTTVSNTTTYFQYLIEAEYEFRSLQ